MTTYKWLIKSNGDRQIVKEMDDYEAAFHALYETMIEVGEIVERGIKGGRKGYRRSLYQIREKLGEIE